MSGVNAKLNVTVGEHIEILSGFPFASDKFNNEEGVPLIRIRDITGNTRPDIFYSGEYADTFVIENNEILIGMDGDFNIVKWKGDKGLLNQRILKICEKKHSEIDLDYLFYWLQPFLKKTNDLTAATTVKHLSTKDVSNAEVVAPKKEYQKKIAKILSTIDQLIEKTQSLIDKHTVIKQGMMADLFTRGIDLKTGQLRPYVEQAPHLYKETELGWVPKDWRTDCLSSMCSSIGDGVHYSVDRVSEGIPFLFVSCIKDGSIRWSNAARISNETYEEISKKSKPYEGMILFTVVGSYGQVAYVADDSPFGFERNIAYLKGNSELVTPRYLFYCLMSDFISRQVERLVVGNAQKLLSLGNLGKINIPVPRKDEQLKINGRIIAISSKLDELSIEIDKYKNIKTGLMQDLLTGKVTVN